MAVSMVSRAKRRGIDMHAILGDPGNVALMVTIAAGVLPIVYFACLYALAP